MRIMDENMQGERRIGRFIVCIIEYYRASVGLVSKLLHTTVETGV